MARVTVEDCVDKVTNRFEIVLLGAHRARAIAAGSPILVERDNDKYPVIALREVAEGAIEAATLREETLRSLQKQVEVDEPVEDNMSALMGEQDAPDDDLSEEELIRALQADTPAK